LGNKPSGRGVFLILNQSLTGSGSRRRWKIHVTLAHKAWEEMGKYNLGVVVL
jgi:hypothetical protein